MNELRLQVRAGDCDQFGHVNNAIYLDFLEHALATILASAGWTEDWGALSEYFWQIRSLEVEYRHPAQLGEELLASFWLDKNDEITPVFGFEMSRSDPETGSDTANIVTRARSEWRCLNRKSGQPAQLPLEMLNSIPQNRGKLPRNFSLPAISEKAKSYNWDHRVMRAELAPTGQVHPRAILNWLEEAVFSAISQAGWPTDRLSEADFITLETRHDTEFLSVPGADDRVRVISRLIDVRRLRGTWYHEIYDKAQEELLREWIKLWAKIVECKHVHIANEQKDRIKQAKLMPVVKGTDACTVSESTLLILSGRATRKMFAVKPCRCT